MIYKSLLPALLILCFQLSPLYAQDTVLTNEGDTIVLYIHKIKSEKLVYKMDDSQKGLKLRKELSEISRISRLNGDTLHFFEGERIPVRVTEMFLKGREDASIFYPGNATAEYLVLAGTALQPLAGLLAAIFITQESPKEHNLNYPDQELMEKENYRIGYEDQAGKVKNKKVMAKWFIGFGVNIIATTFILVTRDN